MTNQLIQTKSGKMEYSQTGQGIPVVLIHGGHSNCKDTLCQKGFDPERFQLITPSRPGYGKTPLNNFKSPKQAAELIHELLEYLSLDKVIIYGVSAGGPTAIELAANYPDKVERLILASAVSRKWLDKTGTTYKAARRMFHPKVQGMVWRMIRFFNRLASKMIAKNFYSQLSKKEAHGLRKEDVDELISALNKYGSGQGFYNDLHQLSNLNNEDTLSKIQCPTLIIHSENDNSVPFEHAKYAHRMIKNSKLEILQNEWGHLFWIGTDSQMSIEKVISFIENEG